ncbi:MAG: 30S ribosomal protein S21 [Planctomycetaceae bacterium]
MVKLRLRDNESVTEAVRRFRKLVEHAGVKKEMRSANSTRSQVTFVVVIVAVPKCEHAARISRRNWKSSKLRLADEVAAARVESSDQSGFPSGLIVF